MDADCEEDLRDNELSSIGLDKNTDMQNTPTISKWSGVVQNFFLEGT